MAFSRENVSIVRERFSTRRREAEEESMRRKEQLYCEIPELWEIDRQLSSVGMRVMAAAVKGGDVERAVAEMKKEHEALRARRDALLVKAGYDAGYTDIHYRCEACSDTGFLGTKMCDCMRRELILLGYESSGVSYLMEGQSFDSFDLRYYTGADAQSMCKNVEILRSFASEFAERSMENYLLIGGTGLGKTHLSTSVARVVIDSGFDVLYDTAQGMFGVFEANRFGRSEPNTEAEERYFTADLLIIDDLGTEMTNQFTVSCLYNVINSRVNRRRATLINTNLSGAELRERYADRITSRLFGEFRPLLFGGKDIRAQKLKIQK